MWNSNDVFIRFRVRLEDVVGSVPISIEPLS